LKAYQSPCLKQLNKSIIDSARWFSAELLLAGWLLLKIAYRILTIK